MAEPLILPPFPPLAWDEDSVAWRGPLTMPWYATADPPDLVVVPDDSADYEAGDVAAAVRPTRAQAAAYELLLDPDPPLRRPLLALFRANVKQLARAEWGDLEGFFELTTVKLFPTALDDVAYIGLVFSCLQFTYGYEHGVGVVAHKNRLVAFGVAETAEYGDPAGEDLQWVTETRRGLGT